jgi:hypothetical protein
MEEMVVLAAKVGQEVPEATQSAAESRWPPVN